MPNVAFQFPRINGIPFDFIVQPNWRIELRLAGVPVNVDADLVGSQQHRFPVVVSSTGKIPLFFIDDAETYSLIVRNEKGEIRLALDPFVFPFVVPVDLGGFGEINRIQRGGNILFRESALTGDVIRYEFLNAPAFVNGDGGVQRASLIPLAPISTETATGVELDATGRGFIRIENAVATNLATISNPVGGQSLVLRFLNGLTTLEHETGNISLASGANVTPAANDVVRLIFDSVSERWIEV